MMCRRPPAVPAQPVPSWSGPAPCRQALLAAAALTLWGCPPEPVYRDVDPAVDYGDASLAAPRGEPVLDVGLYREQLYGPLHDGDTAPVVAGAQGGTWLMPALRARGVKPRATARCHVVTLAGELLGASEEPIRLALAPDTWLETQAFAIPVNHAAPREADPITDLFGREATLECRIVDEDGRTALRVLRLVLVEGT